MFLLKQTKKPKQTTTQLPSQTDEEGEKEGKKKKALTNVLKWSIYGRKRSAERHAVLKLSFPCRILALATDYKCSESNCSSVHDIPGILHRSLSVTEFYSNHVNYFSQKCVLIGFKKKSKLALASAKGTVLHWEPLNLSFSFTSVILWVACKMCSE